MSMIIANNLNAISAYRSLNTNQNGLAQSLSRLSTGYKINSGKDFPAGLVISEQLRAQNIGLERAVQNTQEANNVLGIAEGALNEMNNILNKMNELTVHAANNGVTSPEQVAADQAEIDSSIQTIDRIARTTKYSDEFLLNGNKKIENDTTTMVNNTLDMKLLNDDLSDFSQIFKKDDYRLNISYASSDNGTNEAQKAFMELSSVNAEATQLNTTTYELTKDQSFTISGNGGSRYMSFAAGTHIGEMVSSINNAADSTGVEATLIYDADVEATSSTATVHTIGDSSISGIATTADAALGSVHESGSLDFFMRDENGNIVTQNGITAIGLGADELTPAGTSAYGYTWSASTLEDLSSFTTDGSTDTSKVITMQFAEILSSDLANDKITLKVEGGTINAYNEGGDKLNSAGATLSDGKYEITLDQNLASGKEGTIYIGYDSVTPAATTLGDPDDATRPFAGNGIWKDAAAIGGNINFGLVTDVEDASMLGAGDTIAIDTAGLLSQFNISGGDENDALAAINYNIQQALAEWQKAFNNAGFNVNFNMDTAGLNDGNDNDDALGAVVDPNIDYTNTIRIGMTNMEETSTKEAGVAATGGYSGDNNNKFGAVVFDSNDSWDIKDSAGNVINMDAKVSTGGGTNINFYDVIMHEFGHVFGFDHPENITEANGLMSYNNTSSSGNVYSAGTKDGAILNADGSFRDPFMSDALNAFYNTANATTTTTKVAGPLEDGDSLTITLTSGPSGSGFGGASVIPETGAVTSNGIIQSGGVYVGEDAAAVVNALNATHVANSEIPVDPAGQIVAGYNTDGLGRVYLKMEDSNKYTIYKDQEMTMAVAVGEFAGSSLTSTAREVNDSGLANLIALQRDGSEIAGHTAVIQLDYMQEDVTSSVTGKNHAQGVDMTKLETAMEIDGVQTLTLNGSYLSGIDLGENTSDTGNIFVKFTSTNAGANCQVNLYSDEAMNDDSLVAQSAADLDLTGASQAVRLYAVKQDGEKYDSGLYGSFNIGGVSRDANLSTVIDSTMLAARISSTEYGSKSMLSVEQNEGALWSYTDSTGKNHLLDAGLSGAEHTDYGADAKISVNGHETTLDGISGTAAGLDSTARLVFREGDLGLTTVAAVGYDKGTYGSRAGEMIYDSTDKDNLICHATGSTTEKVDNFTGGMQFQLGEGAGEQERTVIGLKAMTAVDLGKTLDSRTGHTLSINDMLSGGLASLADDPIKAMEIIKNAIDEVSNLRADIGAWQGNLLETNENNLNVAIENITQTESYIRDTDMAKESTEFSKNQIMVQAGTSMLAQANGLSQNVLSLIG